MSHSTSSIYTLADPNSGLVKYVGQSIDVAKRYSLHLYHSKNGRARTHKEKWINTLFAENTRPLLEIIWVGNISEVDKKEIEYICLYKSFGANLTNATNGGKTTSGRKCSEETRALMSSLMKGKCSRPPITEAEKIAASVRQKNFRHSDETKLKLRQLRIGKPSVWSSTEMPDHLKERIAATGRLASKSIVATKDSVETIYSSTKEAEAKTGCDRKTMRLVANGVYKQCKGYKFRFI